MLSTSIVVNALSRHIRNSSLACQSSHDPEVALTDPQLFDEFLELYLVLSLGQKGLHLCHLLKIRESRDCQSMHFAHRIHHCNSSQN